MSTRPFRERAHGSAQHDDQLTWTRLVFRRRRGRRRRGRGRGGVNVCGSDALVGHGLLLSAWRRRRFNARVVVPNGATDDVLNKRRVDRHDAHRVLVDEAGARAAATTSSNSTTATGVSCAYGALVSH